MNNNAQVITFGCRLNIYESQIIKDNLAIAGLDNVAVFNTCSVTAAAERDAKKSIRAFKKHNPDTKVIVTGCAAQTNPKLFEGMEEVDKVLGNEEKLSPVNYRFDDHRVIISDIMQVKEIAPHLVSHFEGKVRGFLQVQNGCDHRCTFCQIPYARGNSRSVPIGMIVEQIKTLLSAGYKEIVFTGVDITAYGADLPGSPTFAQMIRRVLAALPGLERLRISSIDVAEIDEELFELIATNYRIMPHLHISLQAGDNMILKRMKRRHTREQVIEFCNALRIHRPEMSYGADIIAGFPTETDEMFENTLNLIEEADLQYLHVFPYSERENTPAARMPQVDKNIRKKRAAILRAKGKEQVQKFFKQNIGRSTQILIEQNGLAHSENFIPVKFEGSYTPGQIITVNLDALDESFMRFTI
jgi:threonylcarbamoyladenosine tRNA methylthiotransferase MtaB